METLAPTLSPTPLNNLPVEDPKNLIQDVRDFIDSSPAEMRPYLTKMNEILTSTNGQVMDNKDMVAALLDDEFLHSQNVDKDFAYLDPNSQVPFPSPFLRAMGRSEPARLIKNNRFLQLQEFGKPSFHHEDRGLDIVFENPDYEPTPAEREYLKQIKINIVDRFFFKVGNYNSGSAINFGQWLGLAYQDWFDMDDITWEIRVNRLNMPLGFHLWDPTLVKTIIPKKGTKNAPRYDRFDVHEVDDMFDKMPKEYGDRFLRADDMPDHDPQYCYMLKKDTRRFQKYTKERMVKLHFFETTELSRWYRGYSIVEQGIRMVTNIVNSITYNASNFSNSRTPLGILAIMGGMTNRRLLEHYRRLMYSYLSNAENKKRFPIIGVPQGGDMKWVPFNMNSKEMEFHLFITLLFTMLCQLSGTAPEEIGMSSHENALRGSQPFDKSPDGVKQISRDKGLNTFLYFMADAFNRTKFLKLITGMDVKCQFNGLVVEDKKAKIDIREGELKSVSSLNDHLRKENKPSQVLMYGGRNIYDVVGLNNETVTKALDAAEQKESAERERKQQSIDAYSEQLENVPDVDSSDEELVGEYGEPQA